MVSSLGPYVSITSAEHTQTHRYVMPTVWV